MYRVGVCKKWKCLKYKATTQAFLLPTAGRRLTEVKSGQAMGAEHPISFGLNQKKQKFKAVNHYSDYAIQTLMATEKGPKKNRTAFCLE
jgi:hypothetical protein